MGADAITLSGDFGAGPFSVQPARIGSALRRLTLVVAIDGFDAPDDSLLGGSREIAVSSCLAKASIAVSSVPRPTVRPDPYVRLVHTLLELHELMMLCGKPPTPAADPWWLNVLMGGRLDGRGYEDVSGDLYDVSTDEDAFPRQGVAVFLASEGITDHAPGSNDWMCEVLFTLVLPLGDRQDPRPISPYPLIMRKRRDSRALFLFLEADGGSKKSSTGHPCGRGVNPASTD